jgi:hypothetical protein
MDHPKRASPCSLRDVAVELDTSVYRWKRPDIKAASYLMLCLRRGYVLPGRRTIPDQIAEDKTRYYRALESADESLLAGNVDLSKMEELLSDLLAIQLAAIHNEASH